MTPYAKFLTAALAALAAQPLQAGQPMPPIDEIVQV